MTAVDSAARNLDTSTVNPEREFPGIADAGDRTTFLEDVLEGLSASPKSIPCKYFYDERGSQLFDQICELPEYYPTRTELSIMRVNADDMAEAIGPKAQVVELGSGSSLKTRVLLRALDEVTEYVPVDISEEHLHASAAKLEGELPELSTRPIAADFTEGFEVPEPAGVARRVVYFPGSTIGNFEPDGASALLEAVARFVGPGGRALVGFDLVKPKDVLESAYDDAQGVTAAFNLNLLERINRELDANFDLQRFEHVARWEPAPARVRISIRSTAAQEVEVAGRRFAFEAGEEMLTEYSHKYSAPAIERLVHDAGMRTERTWTDPEGRFCVALLAA